MDRLLLNKQQPPESFVFKELRIVVLGKTGSGKSATGNTILDQNAFISRQSLSSVTQECNKETALVEGRNVSVTDTPGFYDTSLQKEKLAEQLGRSVYESRPGVHAFLYVVPLNGRFTEQEGQVAQQLLKAFGKNVSSHVIVLFTHGDNWAGNLEEEIHGNQILSGFVQMFNGRYHIFNNTQRNRQQVTGLLKKIDRMVRENGGRHYTSELFEEANRSDWEKFWMEFREGFIKCIESINALNCCFPARAKDGGYSPLDSDNDDDLVQEKQKTK